MDRKRHWVPEGGDHRRAFREGFQWLSAGTKAGMTSLLAVPGLANLEGVVEAELGPTQTASLRDGKSIVLSSGGRVSLLTQRREPPSWTGGPVLVVWGDRTLLAVVEELHGTTDIVAVPWIDEHVAEWVRTWGVPVLGAPRTVASVATVANSVVRNALLSIVRSINVSTGAAHPSDKAKIVQAFKILKTEGEAFTPEEVRAFFVVEGKMRSRHADAIALMAEQVLNGRSPRLRDTAQHWRADIINVWRKTE